MITRSITSKDVRSYQTALKIARLSQCRYKLGAVIVSNGNVLSVGHNILKTHSDHVLWPKHTVSIHAEHDALRRSQCCVRGATMYVARDGGNRISKPCAKCEEYLLIAGVKYVVFCDGAELIKIRLC